MEDGRLARLFTPSEQMLQTAGFNPTIGDQLVGPNDDARRLGSDSGVIVVNTGILSASLSSGAGSLADGAANGRTIR